MLWKETPRLFLLQSLQVLEPVSVDYDQVFGDMQDAAGDEGGDQKAVQLAGAASSVLNAKAGKEGDDGAGERAAVCNCRISCLIFASSLPSTF